MSPPVRFPYTDVEPGRGEASRMPYMPLTLEANGRVMAARGLIDTGAAVDVLPYDLGLQLGFVWEQQPTVVRLTGNLASAEARVVVARASAAQLPPATLAFAWTRAGDVPLILGQTNFLMEFDVCFFRSQAAFEVAPRRND